LRIITLVDTDGFCSIAETFTLLESTCIGATKAVLKEQPKEQWSRVDMKQWTLGDNRNHATIMGIAAEKIGKPQQIQHPLKRKLTDLLPVNAQTAGNKSRNKAQHIVNANVVGVDRAVVAAAQKDSLKRKKK